MCAIKSLLKAFHIIAKLFNLCRPTLSTCLYYVCLKTFISFSEFINLNFLNLLYYLHFARLGWKTVCLEDMLAFE